MNWFKLAQEKSFSMRNLTKGAIISIIMGSASLFNLNLNENQKEKIAEKAISENLNENQIKEIVKNIPQINLTNTNTNTNTNLADDLIKEEGFRPKAYPDPLSGWKTPTIGVGFNLSKPGAKERISELGLNYDLILKRKQSITKQHALALLNDDIKIAENDAKKIFKDFDSHPENVKNVLTNMSFNLGYNRLSNFTKLIEKINNKDYVNAAEEMKNSSWFKQVGPRGVKLYNKIKS